MKRKTTTIYFPYSENGEHKHKYVGVSFNKDEQDIREVFEDIKGSDIRNQLKIFSYTHLVELAEKEKLTPSQLIKSRIQDIFINNTLTKRIELQPYKIKTWIKRLSKTSKSKKEYKDLIDFLKNISEF